VGDSSPIGAPPRSYRWLKRLAWLVVSVFYRRIDITGADRLPEGAAIVAANHSNGLADPVLLVGKLPGLPRFLAASALWRFPPARLLFTLAGVVPIHRRSDGDDPAKNASVFAACNDALAAGSQLAIFPEGEVHREPAMLPLKTGAARIALGAAADADVADLRIVPIGLVYEDKGRFRSQVAIHVGEPIAVSDWVETYRADTREGVRSLTDELARRLHDVTLNHASWREATVIDRAAAVAKLAEHDSRPRAPEFAERSALHRALAAAITEAGGESGDAFVALESAVQRYRRDLAVLGIEDAREVPNLDPGRIRLRQARLTSETVALAPFAALGVVLDGPVVLAIRLAASRVPHPAWQASAKGVSGLVLLPVAWTAETWWAYRRWGLAPAIGIALAAPVGGLAWIAWRARFLQRRHLVRTLSWLAQPDDALLQTRASRDEIVRQVWALVGPRRMRSVGRELGGGDPAGEREVRHR
jgi:1-acyl-sn-glycerol-3-phosphate acyltransferase